MYKEKTANGVRLSSAAIASTPSANAVLLASELFAHHALYSSWMPEVTVLASDLAAFYEAFESEAYWKPRSMGND
jgi:hypothetical protein